MQIWACADSSNQQWTLPEQRHDRPAGNTPAFGPNVYVFTPSMSTSTIQNDINAVYNTQQSNQFGTQRYELMFEPGTYNVNVPVGFYTEVVGLGQNPTQTVITGGGIHADAAWNGGNATHELLARRGEHHHRPVLRLAPSGRSRRPTRCAGCSIDGNLVLDDDTSGNTTSNWSSGGFISDSIVTGQVNSGTQQQFIMRNDQLRQLDRARTGTWCSSATPASRPRASRARRTPR